MARVVVLGGGIAGHTAALHLTRMLTRSDEVVVVTPNSNWNWIPSNIWVGVGKMKTDQVTFKLGPEGDCGAPQRSPGVHRRPTPGRGLDLPGRPDRHHHRRSGCRTPTRWWRRPTRSQPKLAALSTSGVSVTLTGDSALWANFNTANRSAMLRSEMLSWPVTIIILIIAFGSLVAAGLPLLLTMAGLLVAAGALVITTKFTPVSIWALNFALMFALALGIDYALFLVMRFRSALERRGAEPGDREAIVASVAETVDTAGKAVAFSALTVLASLAAILIVPSPAFRSMAFGIMLSVIAVLAATLTLLPAVLGKLGTNINKGTIRLRRGPARG